MINVKTRVIMISGFREDGKPERITLRFNSDIIVDVIAEQIKQKLNLVEVEKE